MVMQDITIYSLGLHTQRKIHVHKTCALGMCKYFLLYMGALCSLHELQYCHMFVFVRYNLIMLYIEGLYEL